MDKNLTQQPMVRWCCDYLCTGDERIDFKLLAKKRTSFTLFVVLLTFFVLAFIFLVSLVGARPQWLSIFLIIGLVSLVDDTGDRL